MGGYTFTYHAVEEQEISVTASCIASALDKATAAWKRQNHPRLKDVEKPKVSPEMVAHLAKKCGGGV